MSIDKKIERWRAANLIDQETVEKIRDWEQQQRRPVLAWLLGGLGALTVTIGLVSLVAANWDELGRMAKLFADMALLAALGFGIARAQGHWLREILVILYFGAFLASIALVAQTYQLGGEIHTALIFWMVLGTPVALLGRSWLLGLLWVSGALATLGFSTYAFLDTRELSEEATLVLVVGMTCVAISALIFGGSSRLMRAHRPEIGAFFRGLGWTALALVTSLVQFIWYSGWEWESQVHWIAVFFPILGVLIAWRLPSFFNGLPKTSYVIARSAIVVSLLITGAAFIPHSALPIVSLVGFLGLWLAFAFALHAIGALRLLNLATAILALRVLVAYIELFGSLLDTGLAMIFGGLLLIGLAWSWRRLGRRFKIMDEPKSEATP